MCRAFSKSGDHGSHVSIIFFDVIVLVVDVKSVQLDLE